MAQRTLSSPQTIRGQLRWLPVHVVGWALASIGLLTLTGGFEALALIGDSVSIHKWSELATAGLLGGLVWAGVLVCWRAARRPKAGRVLMAARGTAITETLIVLLPFMLLTSGLAQMSINNIAGMLANKAAYEAGRTMWVWEPIDRSNGQKRARLAAAASLAPVAPGNDFMVGVGGDAEMQAMRGIMYATFSPLGWVGGGSGVSKTMASVAAVGGTSSTTGRSMISALDDDAFPRRAARKLTFAYEATKIEPIVGGEVGAKVTYLHYQAFPWFAWITGSYKVGPATRIGYYSTIVRTYTLPAQVR